jgi:hypothetical protein
MAEARRNGGAAAPILMKGEERFLAALRNDGGHSDERWREESP